MARDPQGALVALNRFGFGARGASSDIVNAASDPRGFVKGELARPSDVLLDLPGLQSTPELGQALFAYQLKVKTGREEALKLVPSEVGAGVMDRKPDAPAISNNTTMTMEPDATKPSPAFAPPPSVVQKVFRAEALARIQRATIAEGGFLERLVVFWSNHFCISANKGKPARILGRFVRARSDPSAVLGRFGDMLKAVEQHPAMLFFLDNSAIDRPLLPRAGQNRKRGLNENLAREILELHTLGVGGGYTQEDVTVASAHHHRLDLRRPRGKARASPVVLSSMPMPMSLGHRRLLGKTYDDTGVTQGEAALVDIARRPSTAKFVAQKLAQHFVADNAAAGAGRADKGCVQKD